MRRKVEKQSTLREAHERDLRQLRRAHIDELESQRQAMHLDGRAANLAVVLLRSAAAWYEYHANECRINRGEDILRFEVYRAEVIRLREAAEAIERIGGTGGVSQAYEGSDVDAIDAVCKGEFLP